MRVKVLIALFATLLLPQGTWAQTTYDLTIDGVQVTSENMDNVLSGGDSDNDVSFNPEGNILTIKGFVYINRIVSGLSNLVINLSTFSVYIGLNAGNYNTIESTNENATLTFTLGPNSNGIFYINSSSGYSVISGFKSVEYGPGLYLSTQIPAFYSTTDKKFMNAINQNTPATFIRVVPHKTYPLWMHGGQITDEILDYYNSDNYDGMKFIIDEDASQITLNLKGANNAINSSWDDGGENIFVAFGLSKLIVNIETDYTIGDGPRPNCAFLCADNNCELVFETNEDDPHSITFSEVKTPIEGFKTVTYNQGLAFDAMNKKISVPESYGVTVGGVEVTSANASNITGTSITRGTITFDNSTRTLTLDNVTIYNGGITSEGDLTIDLKGLNSVSAHHYIITGTNATMAPHLTFTTTDETTKLWLQPSWSGALIDGFGELSFENNLHVALGDLEGGGQALIATHIFSGGDGTADSPYLIGKYQDLNDLTDYVGNGLLKNVYYQLIADIDCPTQLRFYPIGYKKNIIISGENHVLEESFKGTFDGNNKTISNMTIYSTKKNYGEYAGMFGYVNGGTIKNLTLSNIKIQNDGAYSGGIAGYVEGGTIKNTLVTGESSVSATDYAGAIIGSNSDATLENNYYAISVTTTTSTGSLKTYRHRGIGDSQKDMFENNATMLYNTHTVILPDIDKEKGSISMPFFYTSNGQNYTVVGGQGVCIQILAKTPNNILSVTVINNVTNETIPLSSESTPEDWKPYYFTMPDADVTVSVEIGDNSQKFDLWIGDKQVSENNCKDILGDGNPNQNKTASFQYFPDLNKLFITNNTDGLNIETNNDEGLIIYLAPNSTNVIGRIVYGGKGNAPLTITTDGNYPGNITLSANSNVISGFSSLTLEQNLVVMDPEDLAYDTNNWWLATTTATIGVPLTPITKEKTIKPDGNELKPEGGSNDVNKVVDDILYTLGNTNDNNEGDGYDDEGFVVINTVTTDQQAAEVTQNCTPGTNEYLEGFKGLTFMVPAGSGEIMFDMETPDGYAMKVMVGDAAPVIAEKHERDVFKIKYNVAEPTYVYAYNAGQISDANSARGIQKGKKTTVHIKVYSIKITPSKVKQSNSAAQASDGKYEGDVMGLEGQDIETDAEIEASRGDVNGDETTNVADIVGIVNAICGRHSATFDKRAADANGDGTVDATDIVIIVNKIMGK